MNIDVIYKMLMEYEYDLCIIVVIALFLLFLLIVLIDVLKWRYYGKK